MTEIDIDQVAMQNIFDRFVREYYALDFIDQDARRMAYKTVESNPTAHKMILDERKKLIGEQDENAQTS